MKKILLLILPLLIFFVSCEKRTEPDTEKPSVTIISPENGSIVYEVVSIICMATDNEGIEKVELWINGVSTNIIDNTEPYSLDWDTTIYEDNYYIIVVRSYDTSGNTTDSDQITLTVDNSASYPTPVELYPIIYQNGSFLISWSQSTDDDFSSYKLYESFSEDMSDETMIFESNEVINTNFAVTGIGVNERRYYQITVTDTINLETTSSIMTGSSYQKIVFVSNRDGNGEIYTMDIEGDNQTKLTEYPESDYNPLWTPDGLKILFCRMIDFMNYDIYVINLDGSNEINLTNSVVIDKNMKISEDGEKIVFFSWGDGYPKDIYIMNSDGSGRTNLTNDETWDGDPDISSDGQKIVWTSRRTGANEIFIMNSDGTEQIELTNNLNGNCSGLPIFSPDGAQIIFSNSNDIYIISSAGGNPTNLTNVGSWVGGYNFSDDGSKIVFHSDPDNDNNHDIFIINSDGSNLINLTNGFGNSMYTDIAQDGQHIIFSSELDEKWDIFIMDINGNNITNISNCQSDDHSSQYQPIP